MRIGLFGGTFDPVHLGHLIAAEDIMKTCKLDRVVFIPSARPPHKNEKSLTSVKDRYNMVKLAIKPFTGFELSDYELKKTGKSFTIDTVRYFISKYPKTDKLYFIVGADIVEQLSTWKSWKELIKEIHFLIMTRPGFKVDKKACKIGTHVEIRNIDVSSSEIRHMIKKGLPPTFMVPETVEKYIYEKHLYRN
ncbi:MAG: nicotinate (nicotinamide) nucleotide adenylyltransferase [Candidatus Firestonebacteria bacterium RIFOXYA2_FULL_40_8]|nr:MAG: nicotinate (nicotinamide) nucleotide adenylyltransferase [Candidatus Firestonebacteria bacterium RIFOXYA2_FULL_40_8]